MPLFYKPVQSTLPSEDGVKKWHPRLIKVGRVIDTQKIGDMIAEKSSLTPGDVHNVIRNLVSVLREQLQNSRTVCLEGLGSFTMISSSSGNGVDTPDEVKPAQIKRLRIRFTPTGTRDSGKNGVTRSMFTGVEYQRWEGAFPEGYENNPGDDSELLD
ncbi:MAG: HU family DNA-binding protein [Bacteroides sp.]|nr:HU family DNA-binding protein [Bacteroides sp.]